MNLSSRIRSRIRFPTSFDRNISTENNSQKKCPLHIGLCPTRKGHIDMCGSWAHMPIQPPVIYITRLRYSFVRVSISILSPIAQNNGTLMS